MSYYMYPTGHLDAGELPKELVLIDSNTQEQQTYVPHRLAVRIKVPHGNHRALGHYECALCMTVVDAQDMFCKHCGAELVGE